MNTKDLFAWIDDQIREAQRQADRTTDQIAVANLIGKIEAFEATQRHATLAEFRKDTM